MLRQDEVEPKTVLWTELMSATLEGDGCIELIRLQSDLIGRTLQRNKSFCHRERVWVVLAACMCVSRIYGMFLQANAMMSPLTMASVYSSSLLEDTVVCCCRNRSFRKLCFKGQTHQCKSKTK